MVRSKGDGPLITGPWLRGDTRGGRTWIVTGKLPREGNTQSMRTNSIVPLRLLQHSAAANGPFSSGNSAKSGPPTSGHVAVVIYSRPYPAANVLRALVHSGFLTVERPAGEDAVRVVNELGPSLIVLAIDPRRERDVQLSRAVCSKTGGAVLALSPGGHPDADAALLNAGADVCIHDAEAGDLFSAQICALARRAGLREPEPPAPLGSIVAGGLVLDIDRREVLRNDTRIALTPTEFKILKLLASNAGRVCSIQDLFREVQGYDASIGEARELTKVYIRRIRRKLEDDPADPEIIVNVRGFGYLLETGSGASRRPAAIAA